jgi:TonB family protein
MGDEVSNMVRKIWSNSEDVIRGEAPQETVATVQSAAPADRRAGRRSLIGVSMLARWRDDRHHEVKVNSRDISDGGIFFHSGADLAIGTEVEVTFTLPSDPGATGNKRLRVQGTIIRAEREADKTGYALTATSCEPLGTEDIVGQARQAARRLDANDSFPSRRSRARRARLLFLACSGLVGFLVLAGVGIFIVRREGGPVNAAAAIRAMVASIRPNPENVRPALVPLSSVERKRTALRTSGVAGATDRRAASSPAEYEAAERNPDAPAVPVGSVAFDSATQPRPFPFDNNNFLTLDVQKGKPVSPLGYIGELPSPPVHSAGPLPASSLASAPAKRESATAMPSSTAVVLLAVVGKDGAVEDVQRASGPVELAPAAMAAIRHWKFQPDHGGAMRRQIYVTVNFTISTE